MSRDVIRWLTLVGAFIAAAAMFVMVMQAADPLRATVSAVGVVGCGALGFRLLACWDSTTVLVHVLGLLLIASILLGAISAGINAHHGAPYNPALWWVLGHRVACCVVAAMWPYWLDRTRAPYRAPLL